MRKIVILAAFYFMANYGGYWSIIVGPFNSSFDCQVIRSQVIGKGFSVTTCWQGGN